MMQKRSQDERDVLEEMKDAVVVELEPMIEVFRESNSQYTRGFIDGLKRVLMLIKRMEGSRRE